MSEVRDAPPENEKPRMAEISSMANLAAKLGFELSENGGWYRVYTQKNEGFSIPRGGTKKELECFTTIMSVDDKYGPRGEKIAVGVRIGDTSSIWEKVFFLHKTEKNHGIPLDIPVNDLGSFKKPSLKAGGYRQIFEFINKLKNEGFFAGQLNILEDQMRQGQKMVDNVVVPTVRTTLPELVNSEDSYIKEGCVYFWGLPKKGLVTSKGIRLEMLPGIIEVSVGRIKILQSGEVDSKYFEQKIHTIAPPLETMLGEKVHSGWHYIEGDEIDAERAVNEALAEARKLGKI